MMEFTAKFHGTPPPTQDQAMLFSDCETGANTSETPTTLAITKTQPWLTAVLVQPATIRVGVNQNGLNAGTYTGAVKVTIPAEETCEPGAEFAIDVKLTVQKGKVKFQ